MCARPNASPPSTMTARCGASSRSQCLPGIAHHHDDVEREVAYDREFRLSPLAEAIDKAKDHGITVVSMQRDWKTVFATEDALAAASAHTSAPCGNG
jgi:hypothetical protein